MIVNRESPPAVEKFSKLTLPGVVELGLHAFESSNANNLLRQIDKLAQGKNAVWAKFFEEWRNCNRAGFGTDIHGIRRFEFFRMRDSDDLLGQHFQLFQERFVRSIKANGFDDEYSFGLAKTLHEMSDNIVQHSHATNEAARGVVSYHTEANYMAITVADLGRGMLKSLHTNPEWERLATSKDAITAIIQKGASSRQGQGEGEGFHQLFRSLIDRNSLVRIRTCDAALNMVGVDSKRQGTLITVPNLSGTQISICCCLRGKAEERQFIT